MLLTLPLSPSTAFAAAPNHGQAQLELSLLDLPYNAAYGLRAPSMDQSLDLAFAVDRLAVYGLRRGFDQVDNPGLRYGLGFPALGALNFLMMYGPIAWSHEEWHRAVLGSQGIHSRDALYHPSAWHDGLIPVDQVSDADLARLKAEDPANTVRLMEAGMEAQEALVRRIGDELFLHDTRGKQRGPLYSSESWMAMSMQVAEIAGLIYDMNCASPSSDARTDAVNRITLTEMSRDFTGLDCNAWIYDMRRPDEPYEARGPHPYGEGIDRYRSLEDLSPEEQQALKNQVKLHFINVLNPQLFYIDGFALPSGGGDRWIASLGQQQTPFGWVIDGRFGLRKGGWSSVAGAHLYVSGERVSPGFDLVVPDVELWGPLSVDLGAGLWLQPKELRWDAERLQPGGLLSVRARASLRPGVDAFLALDAKTAGWVMGQEALDAQVGARSGLVVHLP